MDGMVFNQNQEILKCLTSIANSLDIIAKSQAAQSPLIMPRPKIFQDILNEMFKDTPIADDVK